MSIVNLTSSAEARLHDLLGRDGKLASHGLRLKVVGGGCSGLQYQLGFDDEVTDADNEWKAGEVRLIVDDRSAAYLAGATLDYLDTLQESGFKIENPNAGSTCGCGQSFGA